MIATMKSSPSILLTTPDYPPQVGGLSTFCLNIEQILKELGFRYDLLVWKNLAQLKRFEGKDYLYMVNIHFMGGYFLRERAKYHINFCHGSELLFYSPNFLKKWVKVLLKKRMISYLEQARYNVFISDFTRQKLQHLGMKSDWSRDVIFHNAIATDGEFVEHSLEQDVLRFICVARDVPHKNLDGCVKFCEYLANITRRRIQLYLATPRALSSKTVEICNMWPLADSRREELYRRAHFNLLLSKDNSRWGFFEGFGLTVLEAGKYGVPSIVAGEAGLKESVHHNETGYIFGKISNEMIRRWWLALSDDKYLQMRKDCYQHTLQSHSLDLYRRLFQTIWGGDER